MMDGYFRKAVAEILDKAGLTGDWELEPLAGGGNNRAFLVHSNQAKWFLKHYFTHANESRDRLFSEFAFATFAWNRGIRCIPRPVECLPESRLALYEYIEGKEITPREITAGEIGQAITFIHELNHNQRIIPAAHLPDAAEACFSLAEHAACIERRLARLRSIEASSAINRQLVEFTATLLSPLWSVIENDMKRKAGASGMDLNAAIPAPNRCLSPSDFGFHNALVQSDGVVKFYDFEYAGWDDPAKLICDFFCQVKVPVPKEFYPNFRDEVLRVMGEPERQALRVRILLPVYRLKWCCIVLNHFLPVDSRRRGFARGLSGEELERDKKTQLDKARRMAEAIQEDFGYVF